MVLLPVLALAATLSQQGTPVPQQNYEALISGLAQESSPIDYMQIGLGDPQHRYAPVMHLVDAGFVAIPALLSHLNDSRPTMAVYLPPRGKGALPAERPQTVYTIGDYCAAILLGYQNDSNGESLAPKSVSGKDYEADLQSWWTATKKVTEQDYTYRTVIHARYLPSPIDVRLLQIHFPFVLPAAGDALSVQNQGAYTAQLLVLATHMTFSNQTLTRMCLRFAQGTDPDSVSTAVRTLATIDHDRFDMYMTTLLDKSSTPLAYVTAPSFPEELASLATLTSTPAVWASLTKAAKRADASARRAMITSVDYRNPPEGRRELVLAFLYGFLDDSSKPSPPPDQDPKIVSLTVTPPSGQINNTAAAEIGSMFHMDPPSPDASANEWTSFRKRLPRRVEGRG